MNGNVYLIGAEAVERASHGMAAAAREMANSASSMVESARLMQQLQKDMDYTLLNHQRFLNDWLDRLQGAIEESVPRYEEPIEVRIVTDAEDEDRIDRSEAETLPPTSADTDEFEGPMD